MKEETGTIDGPNGRLAYRRIAGAGPQFVWLGGFKSDMTGTKAQALARWAGETGRAFLRFDYSGHGASDGAFEDGTISAWLGDTLAAIDALGDGPLVLVGSSMGGWIAALAARRIPDRLAGVIFIAPAPDFTEELMWNVMTGPERETLMKEGRLVEHSQYSDEPTIITRALVEDGRNHLILGDGIRIRCPVRILQGMADPDVPWRHALRFAEKIEGGDVETTLIKSGDHRLSKPHEIAKIIALAETLGGV
ncbi:MAG: alpha/beta hydrolase [Parvularculaceae bacterium]|nr:alpha/beta hydrolase [Parvularculaceae bacterium]